MGEIVMIKKLEKIVELHNLMRNVYFFDTTNLDIDTYTAAHSLITNFEFENRQYSVIQTTECEDDCVRYKIKYLCNGTEFKADIRFIKKIINQYSITKNDCLLDEKINDEKR
jgi:hypothetical protein